MPIIGWWMPWRKGWKGESSVITWTTKPDTFFSMAMTGSLVNLVFSSFLFLPLFLLPFSLLCHECWRILESIYDVIMARKMIVFCYLHALSATVSSCGFCGLKGMKKKHWSFFLCFVEDQNKGLWLSLYFFPSAGERKSCLKIFFPTPCSFHSNDTDRENICLFPSSSSSLSSLQSFFFNSFDYTIIHTSITCVCLWLVSFVAIISNLATNFTSEWAIKYFLLYSSLFFSSQESFLQTRSLSWKSVFTLLSFVFCRAWMEFRDESLSETDEKRDWQRQSLFHFWFLLLVLTAISKHLIQRASLHDFCIIYSGYSRHCNLNNLCLSTPSL